MKRVVRLILLGGSTFLALVPALGQQGSDAGSFPAALKSTADLPSVTQLPAGRSTAIGGVIALVDPVRDQLTLNAAGMHPMKILFDERTQIFRDGAKISVLDLRPTQHASIQTTLDDGKVFAVSIHILSNSLESVYQGRIVSYRPRTGEITVADAQSGEPLTLVVSNGAVFVRQGQREFSSMTSSASDLQIGTLVSVNFRPDGQGRGIADHVSILATPGSTFIFDGSISQVDQHAGFFVLISSQEDQSFRIYFNSSQFPQISELRTGNRVRVMARYDGTRYVATSLTIH